MTKRTPLKPDRPLASIVFSKTGKVRTDIEELPREQKQIELVIGEKFAGSLAHFRAIEISTPELSVDEPGDLVSKDKDGGPILIQVVEAIDVTREKLRKQRQLYTEALAKPGLMTALKGFRLTLLADEMEPQFPRLNSPQGKQALDQLATFLENVAASLVTLNLGKRRTRETNISGVKIFADIEHLHSADMAAQLHWGGGRTVQPGEPRLALADTVRTKLDKNYAKPKSPFWLLIYSSDFPLRPEDAETIEASHVLNKTTHPFDMVWFLFPYNNRPLGHLVQLWPELN